MEWFSLFPEWILMEKFLIFSHEKLKFLLQFFVYAVIFVAI